MRITPNMTADNALFNIQKDRTRLNQLTEQITANMNILKPSDDPITTRQLLDLQNIVNQGDQYISNINKADLWLDVTDTALEGMSDILRSIKGIVANVSSGTDNSPEGLRIRNDTISQLTEMRKQLIDLGNTQLGDQYIFAGYSNDSPAFDSTTGAYLGTSDGIAINISKNSTLNMNVTGDAVLKGTLNGAAPGPYGGTDLIATIDNLITEIGNNNTAQVQVLASTLYDSANQITNARGDVASKLLRLESAKNLITRDQNTAKGLISDRQNVDMTKAAIELNQEKTALEAALSATAKISQMSLLDYIN